MANAFSDSDLIARVILHDDRNAFGELVRRHQSNVRGLLRRLTNGDEALADDLSQETFIRAYKNLSKFKGTAKFSCWIYRIAYNQFLSERRKKREYTVGDDVSAVDQAVPDKTRQISLKHDMDLAMKQLSEPERTAIHLCYKEGLTHDEAAEVMDCPIGTVKTHILRGKDKLRLGLQAWQPA